MPTWRNSFALQLNEVITIGGANGNKFGEKPIEVSDPNGGAIHVINKPDIPPGLPEVTFDFLPLAEVTNVDVGSFVTIKGVVIQDCGLKKTTNSQIRVLVVTDASKAKVTLNLWGVHSDTGPAVMDVIFVSEGQVTQFKDDRYVHVQRRSLLWVCDKMLQHANPA